MLSGDFFDELFVLERISASQAVIHVSHRNVPAVLFTEKKEKVEKTEAIRTARDAQDKTLIFLPESFLESKVLDAPYHPSGDGGEGLRRREQFLFG